MDRCKRLFSSLRVALRFGCARMRNEKVVRQEGVRGVHMLNAIN